MTRVASAATFVVSGLPGAGKTSVGRTIAERLKLPLLDKDNFLESLFDAEHAGPEVRHELSRRADDLMLGEAAHHPSAVLVSFWRRIELSTTSGTPIDGLPADRELVEVWCDCPPDLAVDRFFGRTRHLAHGDVDRDRARTLEGFQRLAELGPLGIGRIVRVDTTRPLEADAIIGLLGIR